MGLFVPSPSEKLKKFGIVLGYGFSSGLPLALVGSTLQAWMASEKIDIRLIGVFTLTGLPYTLKFFWAPVMDQFIPKFRLFGIQFGRRKSWILLTQVLILIGLVLMAGFKPSLNVWLMGALGLLVAFFSASQDIVIDAYRTELLDRTEFGMGAAVNNAGYRIAMLFTSAGALILSDLLSWRAVYLICAAAVVPCLALTWFAPEKGENPPAGVVNQRNLLEPFVELLKRKHVVEMLSFITLYKLDVVLAMALMTPFFMDLGFTRTDIGGVTKGFGLAATIAGTFAGGAWLTRLGLYRSLWVFGVLQVISGFLFYLLAVAGHHYPLFVLTIAAENFFSGMGNSAYAALIMSLCNPLYTATQYALLSSLMAVTRVLAGAPTGLAVAAFGWKGFYLAAIFFSIPSLLLLLRYKKWSGLSGTEK